jgi:hypothetical protein
VLVFLSAWLVLWTFGGVSALSAVAWNLAGKEIVSINPNILIIRHDVLGMGRSWEYDASQVCYLRCSSFVSNPSNPSFQQPFSGMVGPGIVFDYGARTYRFGIGLDEAEARLLVTEILQRFPALGSPSAAPQQRFP